MPGIDASKPELIGAGENTLYRLPRRIVARVTRKGQLVAATKEVRISQWLQAPDIPVVQALAGIPQPVAVNGRAVTFWHELPAHRLSTLAELATVLRRLHDLPRLTSSCPRSLPSSVSGNASPRRRL